MSTIPDDISQSPDEPIPGRLFVVARNTTRTSLSQNPGVLPRTTYPRTRACCPGCFVCDTHESCGPPYVMQTKYSGTEVFAGTLLEVAQFRVLRAAAGILAERRCAIRARSWARRIGVHAIRTNSGRAYPRPRHLRPVAHVRCAAKMPRCQGFVDNSTRKEDRSGRTYPRAC
jgi:hypothetical protein